MDNNWAKRLLGGLLLLFSLLLSVTALNVSQAFAADYSNGSYTVSVQSSTTAPQSTSALTFENGQALVKNNEATVELKASQIDGHGIKSAIVNGKKAEIKKPSTIQFRLQAGVPTLEIKVLENGSTKVMAYKLTLKWQKSSSAKTIKASTPSKSATAARADASSNATANKTATNGSAVTADTATSGSQIKPLNSSVTEMTYRVLQANGKSTSEANKYYTHKADVQKLADGSYKVTMHVDYGKNSGMTAKGFVPLTVNGKKVSDVKYGSTAKDYTASFSFTVSSLAALTKSPLKGTIHVTVSLVNISSNFVIYYQFNGAAGNTSSVSSSASSSNSASNGSPAKVLIKRQKANRPSQTSSRRLPQTTEAKTTLASFAGILILVASFSAVIFKKINVL
ncbi:hypothetical protein [Secundilactobacillus folii]|uniref:Cell surface protein n=1 Tax=Secundilactobacillus folii TaxID=2678357 RepID=A0A7X2XVS1_9LACO|nr:hypothetical protein [Secundilactobacillus folii]MTV82598.1 hypothetical protein [Secundilactobacillus folii]